MFPMSCWEKEVIDNKIYFSFDSKIDYYYTYFGIVLTYI